VTQLRQNATEFRCRPGDQPLARVGGQSAAAKEVAHVTRPGTALSASVVLGVVAGLVAALLGVMRPAPQRQEYASLAGACTTVSAVTLDTYVSGTARAVAGQTTGGQREQGSCSRSGLVGAQARFLYARITVYRSATAAAARAAFAAAPSSEENCTCQGRTQAVPGLIARSIVGVLAHPPKPWVPADAIDS
jgi:type II secretory pathway pseudopilin PulG